MNAFEIEAPRNRLSRDRDAGLRENILKLVSDPASGVVAFPARKTSKLRHRKASPADVALIPAPHDVRMSNGVRLVACTSKAGPSLVMALGRTIVGAIVAGVIVGGLIAHDRVDAIGDQIMAGLTLDAPALPVDAPAPSLQTAMINGAAMMDLTVR